MRLPRVALIAALPLLASVAQAQPNAADARTLQACLAAQDGKLGMACIGVIADPCISAEPVTEKQRACAVRELALWEAQLDAALKRVKRGGFKEVDGAVTRSQQTWRSSLKDLCPVFGKIDPGMLPGGEPYCLLQETAARTLLLRRLGEAVNEH
ncbi:MAG: lysozyme inhibitor LprI family protein [Reyranella sp.]|uniref:lysozyme inhibitor LprI family protein n=1 Tax=Reyranella sp. TaxID=1929291 RepID=UPI003D0BBD22